MTAKIRTMLEQALDAYVRNDVDQAKFVAQEDLKVDQQYIETRALVTDSIDDGDVSAKMGSGYLMVDRMLERIGDHIVNLTEWTVYVSTGEMIELNQGKHNGEMLAKMIEHGHSK